MCRIEKMGMRVKGHIYPPGTASITVVHSTVTLLRSLFSRRLPSTVNVTDGNGAMPRKNPLKCS